MEAVIEKLLGKIVGAIGGQNCTCLGDIHYLYIPHMTHMTHVYNMHICILHIIYIYIYTWLMPPEIQFLTLTFRFDARGADGNLLILLVVLCLSGGTAFSGHLERCRGKRNSQGLPSLKRM